MNTLKKNIIVYAAFDGDYEDAWEEYMIYGGLPQVAYDMTSEEKQTQEFNSFRNTPDSFQKIVIVNGTDIC